MSKRISPIAWRAGHGRTGYSHYYSFWGGGLRDYGKSAVKSAIIHHLIESIIPFYTRKWVHINADGGATIKVEIPSAQMLNKGRPLARLKRAVTRKANTGAGTVSIDVTFVQKSRLNVHLIAYEIESAVTKRMSLMPVIGRAISMAKLETSVVGLHIQVKGRFRMSSRKQKVVQFVGSIPFQHFSAPIEWVKRDINGKYGKSTVKVSAMRNV